MFWSAARYLTFTTMKKPAIDVDAIGWSHTGRKLNLNEEGQEPWQADVCKARWEKRERGITDGVDAAEGGDDAKWAKKDVLMSSRTVAPQGPFLKLCPRHPVQFDSCMRVFVQDVRDMHR